VDEIGSFISSNDQLSRGKKNSPEGRPKRGAKAPTAYMFNRILIKKCQSFPKEELEIEGEKPSKPFNVQVTD